MTTPSQKSLTGKELRKFRVGLGLTLSEFMQEVGFNRHSQSVRRRFQRYEMGNLRIPYVLAKLVYMIDTHGMPEWPDHLVAEFDEETDQ